MRPTALRFSLVRFEVVGGLCCRSCVFFPPPIERPQFILETSSGHVLGRTPGFFLR